MIEIHEAGTHEVTVLNTDESAREMHLREAGDPNAGHQFELTVRSQGSYRVVGEQDHHDARTGPVVPRRITVRAWDLPAALRKAADLPLDVWEYQ